MNEDMVVDSVTFFGPWCVENSIGRKTEADSGPHLGLPNHIQCKPLVFVLVPVSEVNYTISGQLPSPIEHELSLSSSSAAQL